MSAAHSPASNERFSLIAAADAIDDDTTWVALAALEAASITQNMRTGGHVIHTGSIQHEASLTVRSGRFAATGGDTLTLHSNSTTTAAAVRG